MMVKVCRGSLSLTILPAAPSVVLPLTLFVCASLCPTTIVPTPFDVIVV
jgi:hypothetical protein